jgi:pimeloyl-ACP methyl ester carboxylesterase
VINDRDFLTLVDNSASRQFGNILRTAPGDAECALRTRFGDALFERMQDLSRKMTATPTGTVVLLPDILRSELYENDEHLWSSPGSIIRGDFDRLQLNGAGHSIRSIEVRNPLKRYYGELQLSLLQRWNVLVFPYDWRLDIRVLARQLKEKIDTSVLSTDGFSIIGHGLGGLVARSYFQQFPDQTSRVQRFIMLGTPNYGSFAIPALYNGVNEVMRLVALLDQEHFMPELLQFAKTFVSTYQMLPFLDKSPDAQRLMDPAAYGDLKPPQERFDQAKAFQEEIAGIPATPCTKGSYIGGYGFQTPYAIADWKNLQSCAGYMWTLAGDGTVPHTLGPIDGLPTYFVHAEHGMLPADERVIQAVIEILTAGNTSTLPTQMPQIDAVTEKVRTQQSLEQERRTDSAIRYPRAHLLREIVRLERQAYPDKISVAETELQDMVFNTARPKARGASAD